MERNRGPTHSPVEKRDVFVGDGTTGWYFKTCFTRLLGSWFMLALPFNFLSYPFFPSLPGSARFSRSLLLLSSSVKRLEAVLKVVGMNTM